MPGRVEVARPRADQFVAWEPALRAAIDGRVVYEPGSIGFRDRNGDDLDLRRSFRVDDAREDIGQFLAEAGYLHLEGVFTDSEMAAVSGELDAAMAVATRDDGASWWARTEDGWYPSRILGFNLKSPTLQELLESDRFKRIGTFTDDAMTQRAPRTGDSAEGLYKKVGVLEGDLRRVVAQGLLAGRPFAADVADSPSGSRSPARSDATVSSVSSPDRAAPTCRQSTCDPISIFRASRCPPTPVT